MPLSPEVRQFFLKFQAEEDIKMFEENPERAMDIYTRFQEVKSDVGNPIDVDALVYQLTTVGLACEYALMQLEELRPVAMVLTQVLLGAAEQQEESE